MKDLLRTRGIRRLENSTSPLLLLATMRRRRRRTAPPIGHGRPQILEERRPIARRETAQAPIDQSAIPLVARGHRH